MTPVRKITVKDIPVSILMEPGKEDYICLTDITRDREGDDHIRNWMRNKNTVEFLGTWELLNNPTFKGVEFDTFLQEAGFNRFNLTPRKWIDATAAIGLVSRPGRNGGTYAHRDIALEFCSWFSPTFKLYLIREYQRLKETEGNPLHLEWQVKRLLSKSNYHLHTEAVKDYILPQRTSEKDAQWLVYAEEADLLNVALWGCTAREWRDANPEYATRNMNLRDVASINELVVLSNLEAFNSEFVKLGISKQQRYERLRDIARAQLAQLDKLDAGRTFRHITG